MKLNDGRSSKRKELKHRKTIDARKCMQLWYRSYSVLNFDGCEVLNTTCNTREGLRFSNSEESFFPTCRALDFIRVPFSFLPSSFPPSFPPPPPPPPPPPCRLCRTSTASTVSSRAQWALPMSKRMSEEMPNRSVDVSENMSNYPQNFNIKVVWCWMIGGIPISGDFQVRIDVRKDARKKIDAR